MFDLEKKRRFFAVAVGPGAHIEATLPTVQTLAQELQLAGIKVQAVDRVETVIGTFRERIHLAIR